MIGEDYYNRIKARWDGLAKPLDSMGQFEDILSRMGAVLEDETIGIFPAAVAVMIGDNGIIEEGVSQSDASVTTSVARAMGKGKSSVCHMARPLGVTIHPYNIGMKERVQLQGVDDSYFVAAGTANFARGWAMTSEQVNEAISNGRAIARQLKEEGNRCIILGEMGIGNTTTSTAVIAALLNKPTAKICGRGAGLSDQGLARKVAVINRAIERNDLMHADAMTVLSAVGGFDIAAMVGVILEAVKLRIPVILDGLITAAAALIASRIDNESADIVFFSHKGREQGIAEVAAVFGQRPVIDGDLALGEGTGAVMFYGCLQTALALYRGNTSFGDMDIAQYQRF